MGTVGILAEKPSAARNFAKALGGKSGTYKGQAYVIAAARGHLYEFKDPTEMVPSDKVDKYKSWEVSDLPWDEKDFSWERELKKGASGTLNDIKKAFATCDEICHGADLDPTGEGDLLGWEIIDALDLHDRKLTRMEFVDESESSLQKAFENRRTMNSMMDEGNYRKAEFRSRFDLLSMQWTRIATKTLGTKGKRAVLRNGRLKSAMVVLVGDQLKAYNNYVKKPVYMPRFVDDKGVTYTNPDAPETPDKNAVDLTPYAASSVTKDKVTEKKTIPPKLLALSGLSAMLSKKGVSSKELLNVYQKMYEDQVVSYPRTEDRTVTHEQFKELLPKVDQIAGVVGVNTEALTRRTPRRSHVKDSGAHGANRPGPNVPSSLSAVESKYGRTGKLIYETLAKNYLTMLAEDYVYDQHSGHITDFPEFTGTTNVAKVQGWKDIFTVDAELADDEDEMSTGGLGATAEPVVGERINPRPAHPSQGWLMKQLEKRSVGTGATQVSTFSEVTSGAKALLKESKKNKLTLTDMGEVNYVLLPGTTIGDLGLTERVYADMDAISEGSLTMEEALAPVKDWVVEDIAQMRDNAANITEEVGKGLTTGTAAKEKATGVWSETGEPVKFNREYAGHRFTDEEVESLLNGAQDLKITCTSKANGSTFQIIGGLKEQSFTDDQGKTHDYVGFTGRIPVDESVYAVGTWVPKNREVKFKRKWMGREFTDKEIGDLLNGQKISFEHEGQIKTGQLEDKSFVNDQGKTIKYVGFTPEVDTSVYAIGEWVGRPGEKIKIKRKWGSHEFSESEIDDLFAGKTVEFEATSKAGKPYTAKGKLEEQVFQADGRNITFYGFKADFGDKRK